MLNSILSAQITLPQFLICELTAMVLGFGTALVFLVRDRHTNAFSQSLALLPGVVTLVIMLVNGNIGAGLAVAGTFALVRFRSAPGSAKEITGLFMSVAIGLACGMGYVGYAALFFLVVAVYSLALSRFRFGEGDYDGTTEKGNTAAAAVITGNPQITKWMVMGANEEGVIGCVRALETNGVDAESACVGMGAYMVVEEYENGTALRAAPYFSDVAIGTYSVNTLFDVIDGNEVEMETAVPAEITTPENYHDILG